MDLAETNPASDAVGFKTTLWSVVLEAREGQSADSRAALERLCGSYWYPLYAYLRRRGNNPHDAQDLIQEFFGRLIEKNILKAVQQERGRFRLFLLTALKRFVANEWKREHAAKRGGKHTAISFDEATAEGRYHLEFSDSTTPDKLFDRSWAVTLMERAQDQLRLEYQDGRRDNHFEHLKIFLSGDRAPCSHAEMGTLLGVSEGAIKVAVHRLRQRYQDCLREQIAQTVATAAEVDEEIRQLFAVFRS